MALQCLREAGVDRGAYIIDVSLRFQNRGWTREVDKACYTRFSITRLATTADTGEPMAEPKIRW